MSCFTWREIVRACQRLLRERCLSVQRRPLCARTHARLNTPIGTPAARASVARLVFALLGSLACALPRFAGPYALKPATTLAIVAPTHALAVVCANAVAVSATILPALAASEWASRRSSR